MKSPPAGGFAMVASRCSVFFRDTFFAIDTVLLPGEQEQHDDEDHQRSLRGHVEADRESQDRNPVQGVDEKMHHEEPLAKLN